MPWFLALLLALLNFPPAQADEAPRISTESAEYCEELFARLAASPVTVTAASRELGEEGRRLCANGHVRTGIAKVRRALRASQVGARRP